MEKGNRSCPKISLVGKICLNHITLHWACLLYLSLAGEGD